jgi:uncharacterized membrane protein
VRATPAHSTAALLDRALFVAWLLFFPNAAYIVTDLMHLNKARGMPRWFDYI